MKKLTYLFVLISLTSFAQIKGNKTVESKTFPFKNVETIKIDLYANITIDMSKNAFLKIETDGNLFEHIDTEIVDGTIHFSQLKWIQPSKGITITIGAPDLKRVVHDTNDTTRIINITGEQLVVNANIGKVIMQGELNELRLGAENGKIDASKVDAKNVYVNLWGWGTISVNPTKSLWADISEGGKLFYSQLPENHTINTDSEGIATAISEKINYTNKDLKWINFKIKNNSGNRNHFVVKGPKADGSYFGYGFPMMPFAKRKEKWSVGTKIYKQSKLGFKKLLVTITAEDEGQTVNLFN